MLKLRNWSNPFMTEAVMTFLYDNVLRHERVKPNVWYLRFYEKLVMKMWFPFNSAKTLKDCYFVVDGSKTLKLSKKTFFDARFQKNVLSSFLLVSSACYQDDLGDSEGNEIVSLMAHTFNSDWLLYVNFPETINLSRNIWLIENW